MVVVKSLREEVVRSFRKEKNNEGEGGMMAGLREGQRQVHPGNMKGITKCSEKTIEERGMIVGGGIGARKSGRWRVRKV